MTVKQNLIAARALIDTPEKWGKGAARKRPSAVDACYEVSGGVAAGAGAAAGVLDGLLKAEGFPDHPRLRPASAFNDHPDTTHADIIALFDRAIAACEVEA